MRHSWSIALFALCLLCAAPRASADAPPYIPVQGFLEGSDGQPVDGATMLRFRLYKTATPTGDASEVLFEETQSVTVSKGFFTAYLGDSTTLPLDLFRSNAIVFVGIRVGSDDQELSPLLQLATAPFAAFANACGDSNTVGGKTLQEIMASAKTTSSGSASGGSTGAQGPAGPAGPKGDPGVLNVNTTGPITASLASQTLTINARAPFATEVTNASTVATTGITDFGFTTQPAPAGATCVVTITAWLSGPTTAVNAASFLHIAAKTASGTVNRDWQTISPIPFFAASAVTMSGAFAPTEPTFYGCSVDNNSTLPNSNCNVMVFCL